MEPTITQDTRQTRSVGRPPKDAAQTIPLKKTALPHVYECDIDDTGLLKEIFLLKKFDDGTLFYIDISQLHNIDKARLRKIVSAPHAAQDEAWELLSRNRLRNGMNALVFFHTNFVKTKRPRGARVDSVSIFDVAPERGGANIGTEYIAGHEVSTVDSQVDLNSFGV